jgi:hypothetical protein
MWELVESILGRMMGKVLFLALLAFPVVAFIGYLGIFAKKEKAEKADAEK